MTTKTPRTLGSLPGVFKEVRLAWRLMRDRRVPLWVKGVPLLSLAYLIWPLDFLADPLLGLGQLDDLGVILLGIMLFVNLVPQQIVRQHQRDLGEEPAPDEHAPQEPQEPAARTVRTTYRILSEDDPRP